jgi:predicted GIY-YIG superfamily endonuclease
MKLDKAGKEHLILEEGIRLNSYLDTVGNKVLYFHINLISNEIFYVGIGNKYRPFDKHHRSKFWKDYTSKYDFKVVIYKSNLTIKDAQDLEKELIHVLGKRVDSSGKLVNINSGGGGAFGLFGDRNPFHGKTHSKETKEKISKHNKGKKLGEDNPFYGKTHSKEVIEKIRNSNKGRIISNEQKKVVSEKLKGRKLSKTTIDNMVKGKREFWKNNPNCNKGLLSKDAIILLDSDTGIFYSLDDAAFITNINKSTLKDLINNRHKKPKKKIRLQKV